MSNLSKILESYFHSTEKTIADHKKALEKKNAVDAFKKAYPTLVSSLDKIEAGDASGMESLKESFQQLTTTFDTFKTEKVTKAEEKFVSRVVELKEGTDYKKLTESLEEAVTDLTVALEEAGLDSAVVDETLAAPVDQTAAGEYKGQQIIPSKGTESDGSQSVKYSIKWEDGQIDAGFATVEEAQKKIDYITSKFPEKFPSAQQEPVIAESDVVDAQDVQTPATVVVPDGTVPQETPELGKPEEKMTAYEEGFNEGRKRYDLVQTSGSKAAKYAESICETELAHRPYSEVKEWQEGFAEGYNIQENIMNRKNPQTKAQ